MANRYALEWRHLTEFAREQNLGNEYSRSLAMRFEDAYGFCVGKRLKPTERWCRHLVFALRILDDYARTGSVVRFVVERSGLALTNDGAIWGWGQNQFSLPFSDAPRLLDLAVPTGVRPIGLAAAYAHALLIAEDGSAWAWGDTIRTVSQINDPVDLSGLPKTGLRPDVSMLIAFALVAENIGSHSGIRRLERRLHALDWFRRPGH